MVQIEYSIKKLANGWVLRVYSSFEVLSADLTDGIFFESYQSALDRLLEVVEEHRAKVKDANSRPTKA